MSQKAWEGEYIDINSGEIWPSAEDCAAFLGVSVPMLISSIVSVRRIQGREIEPLCHWVLYGVPDRA